MTPIEIPVPAAGLMFAGVLLAAITDARTGRIPNPLVASMMLGGAIIHAVLGDPVVPWLGFALATAIHFPLWVLQVQKAGDAKLMMGIGACVGWQEVFDTTLWYAVLYIPIGLLILILRGRLRNLGQAFIWQMHEAWHRVPPQYQAMLPDLPERPEERPKGTMLRTGPVIAVAATMGFFTDWLRFI